MNKTKSTPFQPPSPRALLVPASLVPLRRALRARAGVPAPLRSAENVGDHERDLPLVASRYGELYGILGDFTDHVNNIEDFDVDIVS